MCLSWRRQIIKKVCYFAAAILVKLWASTFTTIKQKKERRIKAVQVYSSLTAADKDKDESRLREWENGSWKMEKLNCHFALLQMGKIADSTTEEKGGGNGRENLSEPRRQDGAQKKRQRKRRWRKRRKREPFEVRGTATNCRRVKLDTTTGRHDAKWIRHAAVVAW